MLPSSISLLDPARLAAQLPGATDEETDALRKLAATLRSPREGASDFEFDARVRVGRRSLPLDFETHTNLNPTAVRELDDYLRIVRVVTDRPAEVLVDGLGVAVRVFDELARLTDLPDEPIDDLALGLVHQIELVKRALGAETKEEPRVPAWTRGAGASRPFSESELLGIWRRGHWLFFVLTQGLVVAFRRLLAALDRGAVAECRLELETAARLLTAAGAAMRITGSFTEREYLDTVRPTMTLGAPRSEVTHTSLSGTMSWDHHYLVHVVWRRELLPRVPHLPSELADSYERFVAAYRDGLSVGHRAVCSKFGGDSMGSLVAPRVLAVKSIENIDARRLEMLRPSAPEASS